MIANILGVKWAWPFLSSLVYQTCTCAPECTQYIQHIPQDSHPTSFQQLNVQVWNTKILSKKPLGTLSLVFKKLQISRVFEADIHEIGLSQDTNFWLRKGYSLLYCVHKTSSDIGGKEATRLHSNTIKYNIGKISLTVWSLFQCQCYRYNTNVPVRRRNSNGMPRSKPGSGNKKGGLE